MKNLIRAIAKKTRNKQKPTTLTNLLYHLLNVRRWNGVTTELCYKLLIPPLEPVSKQSEILDIPRHGLAGAETFLFKAKTEENKRKAINRQLLKIYKDTKTRKIYKMKREGQEHYFDQKWITVNADGSVVPKKIETPTQIITTPKFGATVMSIEQLQQLHSKTPKPRNNKSSIPARIPTKTSSSISSNSAMGRGLIEKEKERFKRSCALCNKCVYAVDHWNESRCDCDEEERRMFHLNCILKKGTLCTKCKKPVITVLHNRLKVFNDGNEVVGYVETVGAGNRVIKVKATKGTNFKLNVLKKMVDIDNQTYFPCCNKHQLYNICEQNNCKLFTVPLVQY